MQPKNFQKASAILLREGRRRVLGSDMGTGKTIVSIMAAEDIVRRGFTGQVWVIAPSSVTYNWGKEIEIWSRWGVSQLTPPRKIQIIKGYSDSVDPTADWVIFSYNVYAHIAKHTPQALGAVAPAVLICDEAHALKSIKSQRTSVIIGQNSVARRTKFVWFLTGDPFPRNIVDGYTIFNFCLFGKLGRFWDFAEKYAYTTIKRFGNSQPLKVAIGCRAHALPELVSAVAPVLIRDTMESAGLELPAFTEQPVWIAPSAKVRQIILENEALTRQVEEALARGDRPPENLTTAMVKMRIELGKEKAPAVADFVTQLVEQGRQVVVYAHHQATIAAVRAALKGVKAATLQGKDAPSVRQALVNDFQSGKYDVLIVSITAGGQGITLTAASVAVYAEEYWTPGWLKQSMARIRRIGQDKHCYYYFMLYEGSIDESIYHSVRQRASQIQGFWDAFEGKSIADTQSDDVDWGEVDAQDWL